MSYTTHSFKAYDGVAIYYYHWKQDSPKGIIQIAHGLGEHAGRYIRFAELLQENGYEVYANDHRVHGNSVKSKDFLGVYEGNNYFDDAMKDMHVLAQIIRRGHPEEKIILFSHSMGTMISRQYITKHNDHLKALILSGTGSFLKGIGDLGVFVSNTVKLFKGRKPSSNLLKKLLFDEFNKKFKPNRTKVDWISRDENEVDIFDKDPLRIKDFSVSMYVDILKCSKQINRAKTFKDTPNDLPIYMFSGDQDPVGEMGKGVKKVANEFLKYGTTNLTLKIYPGGRHEMLNEVNKEEVEKDLLNWLSIFRKEEV